MILVVLTSCYNESVTQSVFTKPKQTPRQKHVDFSTFCDQLQVSLLYLKKQEDVEKVCAFNIKL